MSTDQYTLDDTEYFEACERARHPDSCVCEGCVRLRANIGALRDALLGSGLKIFRPRRDWWSVKGAAAHYAVLEARRASLRATGALTEAAENALIDEMDVLWNAMTDDERDVANRRKDMAFSGV